MASEITVDAGAPNLNLSPDEKRVYGQLFRQADTDNVGVVTGEIAVKFFEKTRLDSRILGEIWQIADKENRGFLTPAGFGIVLRLIGHAQAGREPTPELALQQGPIPRFDGFAPAPAPISTQATGAAAPAAVPLQAQGTGGGPIRIPPLTPEKVAQYTNLFERQNLQDGNMLPGDQAKQIFEKSGLPTEILGRIWQLADTELRGALVLTEFIIAMHLLTSMKTGNLHGLPSILPAALYEAATRRGPPPPAAQRQTSPTGPGPMTAVPRQLTGQLRTGSPLGRSPLAPQTTGDWLITPGDKARWDQLYDELDRSRKGFITGEEAVPFLSQSKLGEDALAQIWDLSDIRSEGRLNRDTFAVAMYLIRQQRSRQDGSSNLPPTLPPNLIPPSMRNQIRPPTAVTTSAFDAPAAAAAAPPPPQAPTPQPKSALDDLFGLDSSPSPAPPASAAAQAAGGLSDPFASSSSPLRPSSPAKPSPTTSSFRPFVPSSSFGRTLTAQATGDSNSSSAAVAAASFSKPTSSLQQQPAPLAQEDDLLGDNDAEISKKLTSDTAELANLSTQIGSLSKHMQEVQGQRATTENQLNQTSLQKKNFEQRLAQLRALYEKEAKDVRALEEQLNASRNETKKIQGELIMLEGTCQELQQQHRQISAAFQADQQENANLKEKIRAVNAEIAQLKPQIEKLKSDARQQKGLAAINKKQLATTEGERDKFKTEVDDLTRSNEELARQISASPPPPAAASAVPAQLASPALSTSSGNNPFFKRSGSTDIMGAFASPPAKSLNDKAFDDVFGPSFGAAAAPAQTATPPPPATSFKPQNTGTSTGSAASFATPATSTPTAVSRQATVSMEPPAPPESRQLSSSFLPFGDATESLTSSRQVSPPVSRLGQVDTVLSEPASNLVASPLEATATGQSIGSSSDGARPAEPNHKPASNGGALFGGSATAGEDGARAAGTAGHSHSDSLNDPFSALDQAKAKQQFDDAFANFNTIRTKEAEPAGNLDTAKAFKNFATEFPPIAQLEKDDDSDSESDRGGFDDDFAPASPRGADKNDTIKPASPTLSKSGPPEGQSGAGASATSNFDDFNSSSEKAATPTPTAPATIVSNISGPKLDDIFGSGSTSQPAPPGSSGGGQAAAASKAPFDDLDDDFDGLEDAKEGSADDDFATISRSGLDDFNPVFDSSPPASHATKSESNLTGTSAPFGIESSFDFASLGSSTGGGGSTAGVGGSPGAAPATTHQNGSATGSGGKSGGADGNDWDALFSDLEEATPGASSAETAKPGEKPTLGRALTEDGEHDAPMLKSLVSMGYSRADALSALEKYDYNLDRAANYLANES